MRVSLNKRIAITLTELLMAFLVIGIICSITIPVITRVYKEKVTVMRLYKFYKEINNAMMMAEKKYGPLDTWEWGTNGSGEDASNILTLILPYLRYQKFCGYKAKGGCIYNGNYYNMNKTTLWGNAETSANRSKLRFSDGSYMWLYTYGNKFRSRVCGQSVGTSRDLDNVCGAFAYDVNGAKGPNLFGIDLFQFYISKYGVVPYGLPGENSGYQNLDKYCNTALNKKESTNGYSCTAWVIEEGNMKYLKEKIQWQ